MSTVRVAILRAPGTNCNRETDTAWQRAGASTETLHIRAAIDAPDALDGFQILTIPGGFSYGDDIAAGRVFASQIRRGLADACLKLFERGGLILGICNGFQVLVKAGLLPDPRKCDGERNCTVTYNDPPGFQDRWTTLQATDSPSAFLEPGRVYELPIAHGEGRVVFRDEAALRDCQMARQDALRFRPPTNGFSPNNAAYNPNGSTADIAGLCDPTGRVFGLMPHPERFVDWTQHPCWTSLPTREHGDGLHLFHRAVAFFC